MSEFWEIPSHGQPTCSYLPTKAFSFNCPPNQSFNSLIFLNNTLSNKTSSQYMCPMTLKSNHHFNFFFFFLGHYSIKCNAHGISKQYCRFSFGCNFWIFYLFWGWPFIGEWKNIDMFFFFTCSFMNLCSIIWSFTGPYNH